MRVVAGSLRGRQLEAPRGDRTRPTSDRVREALFSSLLALAPEMVHGRAALDAFAGSGALGIEALSRGCTSVTFVDRDRCALACLERNIEALGIGGQTCVLPGDSQALASRGSIPGAPFALLLLDPPYRLDPAVSVEIARCLAARDLLEPGAMIVLEHAAGLVPAWPTEIRLVARKRYGTTEVDMAVYERGAGPS